MKDPLFTFVLCLSLRLTSGENSSISILSSQSCSGDCPTQHFTSTYDLPCQDSCEKRGSDYYWCKSRKGWDYCSPGENIDYQGLTCDKRYPCGNYGENHLECSMPNGVWDKCGRVEPRAMIYYTRYVKECIEECRYHESEGYFWCYTRNGWDYCSPRPDHTYKNERCRFDHECGTHDYSYTWCYTTFKVWDYCGVISPGECVFSQTSRAKRQNNSGVICTRKDNNNTRRVTTFKDMRPLFKELEDKLFNEALELINQWKNQCLSDRSRSSVIKSKNVRIDNQGLCYNENNQLCYNLQIQENGPRSPGESSTLAQITVPLDTSDEYMRLAFRESLRGRCMVEVEVNSVPTPPPPNNNQRCCKR